MSDDKNLMNEDMDNSIDRILETRKKESSQREEQRPASSNAPARAPGSNNSHAGPNAPRNNSSLRSNPASGQQSVHNGEAIIGKHAENAPRGDAHERPASVEKNSHSPAGVTPNASVQNRVPGRRITAKPEDEDGDIKIAHSNMHKSNRNNEETRKTDIGSKAKPAGSKNKNKEDVNENDIGGSLVISMLRAIVYIVVVSVIAVIMSVAIINVGNDMYAFVKSDEVIDVTIPENAKREDIAEILYENGVIKYKSVFKLYGSFKHIEENFVAGDYSVTPMMNYKTLYNEFKEKPISGTSWITVPEGYTTDEIIDLMLSYGIGGSKEDYIKAINEDEYDYWFVNELDEGGVMSSGERFYRLDGYLFPDTYEFYNASTAHTVINKFLQRFDEVYTEVYKQRASELGLTTDQAVILASIIEKEAGHSSDFRNVSSVFHNRLNSSDTFPKFESDATVVYAIQHITGERPSEVTHDTITYDSPYNTYLYDSFPPGAIANPGMNALKYAVYPADTNYYFFVSSDSGTTLFATSKWQHDQNVAYIKGSN